MRVDLSRPSNSVRNVMLCATCRRVVARIGTTPGSWDGPRPELFGYPRRADTWTGAHHTTDSSLVRSVKEGCYICNPLLDAFPQQDRKRARYARTFYEIRPDGHQRWLLRFTIELPSGPSSYETPAQVIECHGTFKLLPKNGMLVADVVEFAAKQTSPVLSAPPMKLRLENCTSSDPCKDLVQRWLSQCTCAHLVCNEDWRTTTQYSIRLLNLAGTNVRLEEFTSGTCPNKYVTLSHCWDHLAGGSLSQLTTANLHLLKRGFAESILSTKFQHAIQIARWMGVHYLWIDALCIIQDSVVDWREQSNVMGDIYAGSHCNIAAMNKPGDDGFLKERNLEIIEPFLMQNPERTSSSDTHVIGYDDFWCNSLLTNPLHNRAWVLQERQLSPRTIHFGEQIFWECREHKACEAYPTGIPEEFSNRRTKAWRQGEQVFNPKSKMHHESSQPSWLGAIWAYLLPSKDAARAFPSTKAYEYWSTTVERYMECDLSRANDKLMAIQGLANKVQDTTGERYLVGLWDGPELAHSLLWYSPARQQGNGRPSVKYGLRGMKGYRAPSWSWASLDAKIVWKWPAQYGQLLLHVEETITQSPSEVAAGLASLTEMRVKGWLLAVQLQIMNDNEDGDPEEDGSYAVLPRQMSLTDESLEMVANALSGSDPTILLDEALAPSRATDVYLLPVVTEWRGRIGHPAAEIAGLILRQHQFNTKTVYERIGVFCFDKIITEDMPGSNESSLEAAFAQAGKEHIALI